MSNDLEYAFRAFLKSVVNEVVLEVLDVALDWKTRTPQVTEANDEILLTSREVAKRLAISQRHLGNLTRSGILPCVRVGQSVRYNVETVQTWIRDSESTSGQPVSVEWEPPREPKSNESRTRKTPRRRHSENEFQPSPRKKNSAKSTPPSPAKSTIPATDQKSNPFRRLLSEIGVASDQVPTITNGELQRIAEVDVATLHGWMYLDRELPELALQKLRDHFGKLRPSRGTEQQ